MTLSRRALKSSPFVRERPPAIERLPMAVPLSGGSQMTYDMIYRRQLWVGVMVNKIARGIARIPLKGYERRDDDSRRRLRGKKDSLAAVLKRPMPGVKSAFSWKEAIAANLAIYGNCVVVKMRPTVGAPPNELWTSPFRNWELKPGKDRPVEKYIFNVGGGLKLEYNPEDVIHFKWWGTGDDILGQSPLEQLRQTLHGEDAANRLVSASYDNGLRLSGVLVAPPDRQLDDADAERLRKITEALHGGVDNAFKLAVLTGGLDWKPMSQNLVDGAVKEMRQLNREEAAAIYDMPPPMVGILDRATFSNVSEQHVMLYQDSMGPWVTMIEETLLEQLIFPERLWLDQYCEFDMNAVLRGNVKETAEAYRLMDYLTPNEKRTRENLDRVDDERADMLWMPLNMMPIGDGALEMQERIARLQAAGT